MLNGKLTGESKTGAENILHDITRVSADRDHLAVRHIDNAHQAERNREPQRDNQQNRTETKPAKNGAKEIDPLKCAAQSPEIAIFVSLQHRRS